MIFILFWAVIFYNCQAGRGTPLSQGLLSASYQVEGQRSNTCGQCQPQRAERQCVIIGGGGERVTVCRDHQLPCQHVLPTHTERHRHTNRHYLSLWSGVSPAVCNYSQMDENHLLLGEIKKLVRPFFFSFFLLPFNYSLFHWGLFPEERQRDRLINSRILLCKLAICLLCFWI